MDFDETYTWINDYPIPTNLNRKLLLMEHHEHFVNNILYNLPENDQVVALENLNQLMEQAEYAIILLFASGCMASRDNLSKIDNLSKEHPLKYLKLQAS